MLQHLCCSWPLGGVEGEHQRDALLGVRRDVLPVLGGEGEDAFLHHSQDVGITVPIERRIAAEQNVANHPTAPNITLLIVTTLQHLRCDVVRGAGLGLHLLSGRHLVILGQAKVDHFDGRIWIPVLEQEILWFDVTMNEVVVVQIAHCSQDLLHVSGGTTLIERSGGIASFVLLSLFQDAVEELTTGAEFHDQVDLLGIDEDLVELDDVRVVQRRLNVNFGLEAFSICNLGAVNGLDSTNRVSGLVHTLRDRAI